MSDNGNGRPWLQACWDEFASGVVLIGLLYLVTRMCGCPVF